MKGKSLALVAAVLGGGVLVTQLSTAGPAQSSSGDMTAPQTKAKAAFKLDCDASGSPSHSSRAAKEDAAVRESAQKGLDFLAKSTMAWQEQHSCFGCHVQGVTGEALSVGHHNQYELVNGSMDTVFTGVLSLNGGLRNEQGHAEMHSGLRVPSRAFGGAALARYDRWVSDQYSDDLVTAAQDLLGHQGADGMMTANYENGTVASGTIHSTYQAIQTWKQAYERSADDRWLTAIQKAEQGIQNVVDGWYASAPQSILHVNYAMLALIEASAGSGEKVVADLQRKILATQLADGSWPQYMTGTLVPTEGTTETAPAGAGSVLATGQTLYTLRMLGMNDGDPAIRKGLDWLIARQQADGGWSHGGSEKGEAMWAVLGLVKTDVLSIDVDGIAQFQHVSGNPVITANASDNSGASVAKVEFIVDDVPAWGACSANSSFQWDTSDLESGRHTLDIVATNSAGQVSRRRFDVYAGNVYVTGVGSRFTGDGTEFSMRNIRSEKVDVQLEVFEAKEEGSKNVAGKRVFSTTSAADQGGASFHWDGKDGEKELPRGEYVARVSVKDAAGKVVQTQEVQFVHDTMEAQREKFADVNGKLGLGSADEAAANTWVELLDDDGNVMQRVQTTSAGQYRFRNVKSGRKYKVRASKKGFAAPAAEFEAKAEEDSKVDLMLH